MAAPTMIRFARRSRRQVGRGWQRRRRGGRGKRLLGVGRRGQEAREKGRAESEQGSESHGRTVPFYPGRCQLFARGRRTGITEGETPLKPLLPEHPPASRTVADLARMAYLRTRRAPRLTALFVLTAIACWGEPGARGAASPTSPGAAATAAPDASETDEPVLAPAAPPVPLPPAASTEVAPAAPTSISRPSQAPMQLVAHVAPKLEALSTWVKTHKAELSFALRDLGSGHELMGDGAGKALNPASNQKLITAAVALSELGPDFKFHVGVLGKLDDGVAARLVIRGNGDPTFSYDELRGFGERLVALGLKRVTGGVLVDQSAFDDNYTPPAFEQQPGEWAAFRAPVSGVSLDRNSTTLHVFPTEPGKLARVEFEPPGYVSVQGDVRTEKGKKRDHVGLTLKPHGLLLGAEVAGGIPEGDTVVHLTRRIENPEIYAGAVLKRILTTLGVVVVGDAKRGGEDEVAAELVGRDSVKLSELVQQLAKPATIFTPRRCSRRWPPKSAASRAAPKTPRKSSSIGSRRGSSPTTALRSATARVCTTPTA